MKNKLNVEVMTFVCCTVCESVEEFCGIVPLVSREVSRFYDIHSECQKPSEYFCVNNCGTITLAPDEVCYRCKLEMTLDADLAGYASLVQECTRQPQHDGPCNGLPSATCLVFQSEVELKLCKCDNQLCSPCWFAAVTEDGYCQFCYEICKEPELQFACACYRKCPIKVNTKRDMCKLCEALGCNSPKKDEARLRKVFADKPLEEPQEVPKSPVQRIREWLKK